MIETKGFDTIEIEQMLGKIGIECWQEDLEISKLWDGLKEIKFL